MTLKNLKQRASTSARIRGHKLNRWEHDPRQPMQRAETSCKVCGMTVHADTNPAPNGIDIGGEAVALNCGAPLGALSTHPRTMRA